MTNLPRKKVLYLITKSNWGGAQRYVYDLATNLDKARFEAVVALGGDGPLVTLLTHAGIRVIKIDSLSRDLSIKEEWLFFLDLWHLIQQERPDVLHVNSSKAGAVGTLVGRLNRVPKVVFTAHGWAFNEDRPFSQRLIIKFLHWLTVLFSHVTIAVSKAIMNQLAWPFTASKFKIINPGRTIGVMYTKDEARAKLSDFCPDLLSRNTDTWIVTIAELHPIKRLPILIEAMKHVTIQHPNVISLIIGEGEMRPVLESKIQTLGLTNNVFLLGSLTEAARFLLAADLFVLPSKSESYGYVVHEAGLVGVPLIATNVGGIVDIVSDASLGVLIPPDNVRALVDALLESLQNPIAAKQRAEALQKKLKENTVVKMTIATTALYELPLH